MKKKEQINVKKKIEPINLKKIIGPTKNIIDNKKKLE